MPSKTLRETALALSGLRSRRLHGVDLSLRRETSVADFTRHRDNVMLGERRRVESRLEAFGVQRRTGSGCFVDAHTIRIGAERVRGGLILIATGSTPFHPPSSTLPTRVCILHEILEIQAMPRKLAIVGAGVSAANTPPRSARLARNVT